ncbi:uncharacterized protein LOC134406493 [Elgaria multicarinata webbii]|uniref:uncharacterized protein LOC134406493 n=1 Tax=Elgaria multicarinata webbii TaxID=159646 RepID=UPI002FCD03D6
MGVILLIPMLVFLEASSSEIIPASSTGALHAPKLISEPPYHEYFEGEKVVLTCSAYQNGTVAGYRFFNQDGQQILKMAPNPFQKGKLTFKAQMNSSGNYRCDYWMEEANTSPQSNTISLRVNEAPAAPSLSLNPDLHLYNPGDAVSLRCSAPPEAKDIQEFQYYGDRKCVSAMASYGSIYMYNMSIMEPKDLGPFRCAYVLRLSGRFVLSKKSNPVHINGTGVQWARMLAIGGSFFTINGLIFLISHLLS